MMTNVSILADRSLAQRLEMGHTWRSVEYARAQAWLQPGSESVVLPLAGGYAVYAGAGSPLNKASGLGFTRPVTGDDLERLEAFYEERGQEPRIELCPLADLSLRDRLRARGYRLEYFLNVLFRRLEEPLEAIAPPAGVRLTRAQPEEAALWLQTTAQGFDEMEHPTVETVAIMAPNFHSAIATCFFAWVGQEPAAGAAMATHEGVSEFGGTSTRLAFRRRGIQAALLRARLQAAAELGCDLVLSLTTPGSSSERNLARAGFHLAYTKAFLVKD